jgi:hypothetical protein
MLLAGTASSTKSLRLILRQTQAFHQLPTETKERDQSILLKNISTKSADFTYFPRIILRKIFS